MAVRLTCLTEAGGRGNYTSAAEINIIGPVQTPADHAAIGEWGPVIHFPLVPVAAAALPNNKVCTCDALHELYAHDWKRPSCETLAAQAASRIAQWCVTRGGCQCAV